MSSHLLKDQRPSTPEAQVNSKVLQLPSTITVTLGFSRDMSTPRLSMSRTRPSLKVSRAINLITRTGDRTKLLLPEQKLNMFNLVMIGTNFNLIVLSDNSQRFQDDHLSHFCSSRCKSSLGNFYLFLFVNYLFL
jgi:hypothetical protein